MGTKQYESWWVAEGPSGKSCEQHVTKLTIRKIKHGVLEKLPFSSMTVPFKPPFCWGIFHIWWHQRLIEAQYIPLHHRIPWFYLLNLPWKPAFRGVSSRYFSTCSICFFSPFKPPFAVVCAKHPPGGGLEARSGGEAIRKRRELCELCELVKPGLVPHRGNPRNPIGELTVVTIRIQGIVVVWSKDIPWVSWIYQAPGFENP